MLKQIQAFLRDEEGISSIEYAMIAVAIAIVVFAAAQGVGTNLTTAFSSIAAKI